MCLSGALLTSPVSTAQLKNGRNVAHIRRMVAVSYTSRSEAKYSSDCLRRECVQLGVTQFVTEAPEVVDAGFDSGLAATGSVEKEDVACNGI